jgi:hypothetical protein
MRYPGIDRRRRLLYFENRRLAATHERTVSGEARAAAPETAHRAKRGVRQPAVCFLLNQRFFSVSMRSRAGVLGRRRALIGSWLDV